MDKLVVVCDTDRRKGMVIHPYILKTRDGSFLALNEYNSLFAVSFMVAAVCFPYRLVIFFASSKLTQFK